jgi:hypothetical protein
MFKLRIVATVVFLAMIVMVFISTFVLATERSVSVSLPLPLFHFRHHFWHFAHARDIVFVVLEYLAFLWHTLSYIPYARTAVLKVFGLA